MPEKPCVCGATVYPLEWYYTSTAPRTNSGEEYQRVLGLCIGSSSIKTTIQWRRGKFCLQFTVWCLISHSASYCLKPYTKNTLLLSAPNDIIGPNWKYMSKVWFHGKDLQFTSRIIAKDVSFLMLKKCTPMGRKRESISVRGWMKKIGQFKLFVKSEELPQEDRRNRFNKWRLIVLLLILMNRSGQDITEDRWKRALGPEDKQGPQQGLVDWMQWQWASAPILILIVWCDTARIWKCNMVLHKQDPWHVGPLRGLPAHIWLVSVWFSPVEPT